MDSKEQVRFSSAEISLVVHATENKDNILESIAAGISINQERFKEQTHEGHFGNKIVLMTAILTSQEANNLAVKLLSDLNSTDRSSLLNNFSQYIDDRGNLYLRLDKQKLCKGRIALADGDSIRVRFKPVRRYKPRDNMQDYRVLLSSRE